MLKAVNGAMSRARGATACGNEELLCVARGCGRSATVSQYVKIRGEIVRYNLDFISVLHARVSGLMDHYHVVEVVERLHVLVGACSA